VWSQVQSLPRPPYSFPILQSDIAERISLAVVVSNLRKQRPWVAAMLFVAVAMRLVVPSGWMPSVDASGIKITICSGLGIVEATIGADGKIHKSSPHDGIAKDSPCAFASVGAADVAHAVAAPLLGAPSPLPLALPHYLTIGQGLAAPPPPSTGPPSLF
jgi:hypothetical protein